MGLPATQPLGLMYLQTGSGVAAQPVSPANSGVSERRVRVRLKEMAWGGKDDGEETEWVVKRAHWCLRVEPVEYDGERRMQVVLCGVKIEALSVERRRNVERGFLGTK
jgi:hypothetical protein